MYNVRVTEVGVPVSFKVFDAFFVQEKEWNSNFVFRLLHEEFNSPFSKSRFCKSMHSIILSLSVLSFLFL